MQQYFSQNHSSPNYRFLAGVVALFIGFTGCNSATPTSSDTAGSESSQADATTDTETAASDAASESLVDVVASYSVVCILLLKLWRMRRS